MMGPINHGKHWETPQRWFLGYSTIGSLIQLFVILVSVRS
jgi:hypothetical protein